MTRLRYSILLPFVVLALSVATTGVWWHLLVQEEEDNVREEFQSQARQSSAELREKLLGFEEVLQAGAGLLAASDIVSTDEWRRFVGRLDLQRGYAGIVAVNYAERVTPDHLDALRQRIRSQGHPHFNVWPEGTRDEHVVTVLAERFGAPHVRAMGFDLMSEPARRRALERARDTGRMSLSGRVNLLVDAADNPRAGLQMFMPVYRGDREQSSVPPTSAVRRYIDSMMSAGLRAKSLVERILAFSRSGVGPRVPVHVQSVVVEALEMLSASLPDNIHLEQTLDADDSAVLGDATQIHQVVLNLCTNAVHAMKSGGTLEVRLDVASCAEPHTVISGALPPGEYVRLCVRDTGSGIEPQLRDRIFDPFFTTKGVGVGTGLGLSLVHGIVADLGGGVDMASEPGRGTTFSVYLPRQGRVDPASSDDESIPLGNGAAVIVVDDEEALVHLGEE